MFIQTERTPNPATLKFLPGREVMGEGGTADFPDAEAASASPLAEALFGLDEVEGVFFGHDFVTVTKREDDEWQALKPRILGVMMQHFTSGAPLLKEGAELGPAHTDSGEADGVDGEVVSQIKALLDEKVRPAVAQDGGDITYHGFEDGVVYLHMQGACSGCPSSTMTLKQGIENLLRYYIPEVTEVRPLV